LLGKLKLSLSREFVITEMSYFVIVRERGRAWDWAMPMRSQVQWDAHAAFMDALAEGFD
jgi:hypothetical protein